MIVLLVLVAYFVAVVFAGGLIARLLAMRPHCHGQGSYTWTRQSDCHAYCNPRQGVECWRGDGTPGVTQILQGTGLGLVWPLLVLPGLVWLTAQIKFGGKRLVDSAYIEKMEKDLGMYAENAKPSDFRGRV